MFGRIVSLVVVGALGVSGQAMAASSATLSNIKGAVSVSHAGTLGAATAGALQAGDRVVAADGQATLSYADGCVVQLAPRSMATIGSQSPCATGQGVIKAADGTTAQFGQNLTPAQTVGAWFAVGAFLYGASQVLSDDDTVSP